MAKLDYAIKSEPYTCNHKEWTRRVWLLALAVLRQLCCCHSDGSAVFTAVQQSTTWAHHSSVIRALFAHLWDTGQFWVWANDCWLGLTRSPVLGNKETRWPLPIAWCQVTKLTLHLKPIAAFCDLRALSAFKMWWHFSRSCSCSENTDTWKYGLTSQRGRHGRYDNEPVLVPCSWPESEHSGVVLMKRSARTRRRNHLSSDGPWCSGRNSWLVFNIRW